MGLNQVSRDHQPVTQEEICRTESPKTSSRGKASAADLLALALSFILLVLAACATDGSPDEEGKEAGVPALGLEEGRNGSPHPTLTPTAPAVGQGGRDKIPSARSTPPDPAVGQDGATRPAPTSPTAIPVIAAGGAAEGRVRGQVLLEGLYSSSDVTIEVTRVPDTVRVEVVAEGLEVPWALAFTPDGRILVTERAGSIRVIQDGVLLETPLATLIVASVSESGLMGIALHPDFTTNRHFFVCYTYLDQAGQLRNRIARLTDVAGAGVDHRVILDDIPGARNHDGCRLGFGPDRKLYATMGDAQSAERAQDLASPSGKVLRLEADGSVPPDNPFPGTYVYSYGHRNPQGLDWHPDTGDLFITEHGPDRNDEINILEAGGNYGWPRFTGVILDDRYVDPILTFTPTVALAGAAFYSGDRLAATWEGNFIFATLRASHLHRVVLEPPEFRSVLSHRRLFENEFGRLRAMAMAPDGYLYFTTSNRDGRGRPFPRDDKVLRLVPVPADPPRLYQPAAAGNFALDLEAGTYQLSLKVPAFQSSALRVVVPKEGEVVLETVELRRAR